jgi:hypothetical protein
MEARIVPNTRMLVGGIGVSHRGALEVSFVSMRIDRYPRDGIMPCWH